MSQSYRIPLILGVMALGAWLLMELSMKVYVFSPTHGVVTRDGVPVANAEVERSYKWGWLSKEGSEKTRTDSQGRFSFGEVTDWSIVHSFVPFPDRVGQRIVIRVGGKEYRAWETIKENFKPLGEIGRPIDLRCELNANDIFRETHGGIAELDPSIKESVHE